MRVNHIKLNLLFPVQIAYLVLLACGVIPFAAVWVVVAIIMSHAELNVGWDR